MAKVKFTDKWLKAVATISGQAQTDYWDESIQGLGLRVSLGGRKAWVLGFRIDGRWKRYTFGKYPEKSLSDARATGRKLLSDVDKGLDPSKLKKLDRTSLTYNELVDFYIENHARPKKRSWEKDRSILYRDSIKSWGSLKAKDIEKRDIKALLAKVKSRGAPIMANRSLAAIRKVFNFGIEEELVTTNPCWRIQSPSREVECERVLTNGEIRKIWSATELEGVSTRTIFKLRFLTGQRGKEIREMMWKEIDFETGWWTIPGDKSKNGKSHRVPLSTLALDLIKSLESKDVSPFLFPSPRDFQAPIQSLYKAWGRVKLRCGVSNFVERDIRRTVASNLTGELRVPRLVVSKILNHKEKGITRVYDRHSYDMEKKDALNLWHLHLQVILKIKQVEAAKLTNTIIEKVL